MADQELRPEDVGPFPLKQVSAVAIAASVGMASPLARVSNAAKRIEEAMANAVSWCYGEGITDPELVREKMMQARENVERDLAQEAVTPQGNPES